MKIAWLWIIVYTGLLVAQENETVLVFPKKRHDKRLHRKKAVDQQEAPRLHPNPIIETVNLDDDGKTISWQADEKIVRPEQELHEQEKGVVVSHDPLPAVILPPEKNQQPPTATDSSREENAQREATKALVQKAVKFLQDNPEHVAFSAFTHDDKFRLGDTYIFVYDTDGICLAQGELSSQVWDNNYNLKDQFGTAVIQLILSEAHTPQNNGWVTYQWRNTTKNSYVQEVVKNNQTYTIGAGYYPHSKENAVVGLVKGAVALFRDMVKRGLPVEAAFGVMSYPKGRFVFGDLYLFALDFNGIVVAHGERFDTIGTDELDYKDAQGVMINREIMKLLREKGTGIWINYQSKGTSKRTYAERVVDAKGKEYFIACGYYPESNRDRVLDLVARGSQYLDQHGETQAIREFSKTRRKSAFVFGDLYLYMFSTDGVCLAHGGNEELIGKNLIDDRDENGIPYVQELIKKAENGGGWIDYKIKNAFFSAYVEKVEVGLKNYIVGSGLFPVSAFETQILLTQSALGELQTKPLKIACAEFASTQDKFIRGDLGIFVLDSSGILYVFKDMSDLVWKNLINAKDDTGKPYIKMIVEQGLKEPGAVHYRLLGQNTRVYVESIVIDGKRYIIGSGSCL